MPLAVGVPDSVRAAWMGHTVAVNRKHYTPTPKDLSQVGETIGELGLFTPRVS